MVKIIGFAGSNSKNSINKKLVEYAMKQIDPALSYEIEVIDMLEYLTVPMYSVDLQNEEGIPELIKNFVDRLQGADRYVISSSEHNGNMSAFFKNILDWSSRYNLKFLNNKNVLLLSTSPGGFGGKNSLEVCQRTLPFFGGVIFKTFSFGSFYQKFVEGEITDEVILAEFVTIVKEFAALPAAEATQ